MVVETILELEGFVNLYGPSWLCGLTKIQTLGLVASSKTQRLIFTKQGRPDARYS